MTNLNPLPYSSSRRSWASIGLFSQSLCLFSFSSISLKVSATGDVLNPKPFAPLRGRNDLLLLAFDVIVDSFDSGLQADWRFKAAMFIVLALALEAEAFGGLV